MLDTDIIIFMHRGFKKPSGHALHQTANKIRNTCRHMKQAGHQVGLSFFTICELEYGSRVSGRYTQEAALVQAIVNPFTAFDFDVRTGAEQYGIVRYSLSTMGTMIGPMDLLIAAHALALSATLVSNNTAHFNRVPHLKIANWR